MRVLLRIYFTIFFFFQQLFRSQQSQAATPSAAQLQLLQQQQQQYLAQQQQAAFPQPPYLVNPQQEPYLITAGVPQYYGVGPWVYPAPPANLIQQGGASNGARRPLTPNGTAEAQQQVQVCGRFSILVGGKLRKVAKRRDLFVFFLNLQHGYRLVSKFLEIFFTIEGSLGSVENFVLCTFSIYLLLVYRQEVYHCFYFVT